MAHKYLNHVLSVIIGASELHIVFDKYQNESIKAHSRAKRGDYNGSGVHAIMWKDFFIQNRKQSHISNFLHK